MKVIGRRGKNQYMLAKSINSETARVLDVEQGKLFPSEKSQSILKWGYWEEYSLPQSELDKLLAEVERL